MLCRAASRRKSSPSWRVRLATERSWPFLPKQPVRETRECRSYGCRRRPRFRPCATALQRHRHQRPDAGENDRARRAVRAAPDPDPPAQAGAQGSGEILRVPGRSGRVKANTERPCAQASWAMMCAAAPNPYRPRRLPSPAALSARQPINPAQSKGASAASSPASPKGNT